jgi:hypothetical protein
MSSITTPPVPAAGCIERVDVLGQLIHEYTAQPDSNHRAGLLNRMTRPTVVPIHAARPASGRQRTDVSASRTPQVTNPGTRSIDRAYPAPGDRALRLVDQGWIPHPVGYAGGQQACAVLNAMRPHDIAWVAAAVVRRVFVNPTAAGTNRAMATAR